jgi:hypothetical protein
VIRHRPLGHVGVLAIGGQRVLDEVVGADREEIATGGDGVGVQRSRGHLDHRADKRIRSAGRNRVAGAMGDRPHRLDLGCLRHHRDQDP